MFGIFKKRQPTVMDAAVRAIYGDNPPAKSADLERAITIAHEDLLAEQVPIDDVDRLASGLFAGPMPYSTHDLAVATALSFFKAPELFDALNDFQVAARLRVLNWMKAGKVAPGVLSIFEDTLYRLYKPGAEVASAPPPLPPEPTSAPARYPAIVVDLSDLGGEMFPILRRVAYAMSDAEVDDAEIEQYKAEMKVGHDPVAVTRRWVSVRSPAGFAPKMEARPQSRIEEPAREYGGDLIDALRFTEAAQQWFETSGLMGGLKGPCKSRGIEAEHTGAVHAILKVDLCIMKLMKVRDYDAMLEQENELATAAKDMVSAMEELSEAADAEQLDVSATGAIVNSLLEVLRTRGML